jgi:hypothetical protein
MCIIGEIREWRARVQRLGLLLREGARSLVDTAGGCALRFCTPDLYPAVTKGTIPCVDQREDLDLAGAHVNQSTGRIRVGKPRTLAGVMMQ